MKRGYDESDVMYSPHINDILSLRVVGLDYRLREQWLRAPHSDNRSGSNDNCSDRYDSRDDTV